MTDRANRFEAARAREEDLPPEVDNSEQDQDADGQAQTVADEALTRSTDQALEASEKVSTGSDFDDVPDLIDRMKQMDSSGRIDMDAFRGEPNDDDEEDMLGDQGEDDQAE